jgi:hypothetical protein
MSCYDIPLDCDSVFDAMLYTVEAMKDSGFMKEDIANYVSEALDGDNLHILEVTRNTLDDCNSLVKRDCEDIWRDSYYSSFWDDDFVRENENNDENNYDSCSDYLTVNNALEDINNIDDDVEMYEGFSSCGNHYFDSVNGLSKTMDNIYNNDYFYNDDKL